jgi:4'-phosphopantetheinyl transferase
VTSLALTADQVHVWLVFEDEVQPDALLAEYRKLLTDEERLAAERFHFLEDRRQYVIARALTRTVLSRYAEVPPEAWRFIRDEFGRPHVAPDQRPPALPAFNISHTQGLIVCAVTRAPEIGVDVERVSSSRASLDIADRYFSPAEAGALREVPPSQQSERFFHYWTLKEAYIKARGKGLSIPLAQFGFDFPEERALAVSFDARLDDQPARWKFWLCRPSAEHLVAVCAGGASGNSPRLAMRKVVPLRTEQPFQCEMLRESERFAG